ncbi:MAG: hypothetical protein KFW09_01020 [Oscillospiraceae bacterium]|nr:hypothetical protein [Oscillospiraceae bacterium]
MKISKIILIFSISICILVLSSCTNKNNLNYSNTQNISNLSKPFSSNIEISLKENKMIASINKHADNTYDILFIEPSYFNDLKISYLNGDILISYKDLSIDLKKNSIISKSIISMIIKSLNTCLNDTGVSIKSKDGLLEIQGNIDENISFLLKLSQISGEIVSIDIPSIELFINFNSFKYNK